MDGFLQKGFNCANYWHDFRKAALTTTEALKMSKYLFDFGFTLTKETTLGFSCDVTEKKAFERQSKLLNFDERLQRQILFSLE